MSAWRSALVVVVGLAGLRAQHAIVEVLGASQAYVQQPVEFVVAVEYDAAWFAEHAVPLSRQRLAVPVHVDVPWLMASADRTVEWLPVADDRAASLAVGDRLVAAARRPPVRRAGRTFERLELRARWLPLAAGTSHVGAVRLRYRYAETFEQDLLRGRQPVDAQQVEVTSEAADLLVRALPSPPAPGFTGAVGEFSIAASVARDSVCVGDTFAVTVTLQGEGNLFRFASLRRPELPGFHVEGVVGRRIPGSGARTFALDVLALREGALGVPAIEFVSFSPQAGDYVTLATEPVPLQVLRAPAGRKFSPRVQRLIKQQQKSWFGWYVIPIGAAVGALFGWLYAFVARQIKSRRASGSRKRLRRALAQVSFDDAQAVVTTFEAVVAAEVLDGRAIVAMRERLEAARFGGLMPERAELFAAIDRPTGDC